MSEKTTARKKDQFPRLDLLGSWGDDDSDGLSGYERQRYLDRMAATEKGTAEDSGVRKIAEIQRAEASPKVEHFAMPKFGTFIGYNEIRQHNNSVGSLLTKFKQTVNLILEKVPAAAATPLDVVEDIKFDHSALAAAEAVEASPEDELDMEIAKNFDDIGAVGKRQKAKLIGIIHHYNNAAELSYMEQRSTRKSQVTPSRLANLWNFMKRPIRGVVDIIAPNYAINRNFYESHVAYAESAKAEAKNHLETDIQSISDSYEVLADYVDIKFGEDFAFNVDDNEVVDTFLNDCLFTPDSPHYQMIMAETQNRVKERIAQYNAEIAEIDAEAGSIQYRETTKELLAGSRMLRIKKGINDTFTDVKLDTALAWARIRGKKVSEAKKPSWTKREIPAVLGAAVTFQANHQAYLKEDAMETDAQKMEKKIVKDGRNGKRAGFLFGAAAVIAGLVGGGYIIKKVVDGRMADNKAMAGLADAAKALRDKKVKTVPTSDSASDTNPAAYNVDSAKPSAKAAPSRSIGLKTVKTGVGLTTTQTKAKISTTKVEGLGIEKPKSEKVEQKKTEQNKTEKKDVSEQLVSEAMKMDEINFGEKKLKIYTEAMQEITQPVELVGGKKVPYRPNLLAFNAVLEEIGQAHLTLKTRKDVIALHAIYARADRMIGEYQIARDNLIGPSYVAETDHNVGMARNSLARVKSLLAGRSGKFQIAVPVKKIDKSAEVTRINDINLTDIDQALTTLNTESHAKSFPSQKKAQWMVDSSKYYRAQLEFAEWYLAHDASKVRF